MFSINDILIDTVEEKTYRVLWLDSPSDVAYVIDLSEHGLPSVESISRLEEQIQSGSLAANSEGQMRTELESEILNRDKAFRDAAWKIIEPLVTNEPAIYDRTVRSPLIAEAEQKSGVTKKTIYKYLRWYWQRGKAKNALLPNIKNRGGRAYPKSQQRGKLAGRENMAKDLGVTSMRRRYTFLSKP